MSRSILFFASLIVVVAVIQGQLIGGYNPLAEDRHVALLETVNKNSNLFTDDLLEYRLITIKCAHSQVVAGTNYKLIGEFERGSDRKVCELVLSENLNGEVVGVRTDCSVTVC